MKKTDLNKVTKEKITHARGKWEVLRRNKSFQNDFENKNTFGYSCFNQKWKVIRDKSLDVGLSFDELVKKRAEESSKLTKSKALSYAYDHYIWVLIEGYRELYFDKAAYFDREKNFNIDDTGIAQISVNLNFSRNQIEHEFKTLLDYMLLTFNKEKTKKKHPHRWDLFTIYFKVYDMKNNGIPPSKIAEQIFPDNYDGKIKVDQYYKKAKSLITNPLQVCDLDLKFTKEKIKEEK